VVDLLAEDACEMTPLLTVAIVSKNESQHIAACIESAVRGCAFLPPEAREIILVDSYSTDDTVAVASRYNITIARLGQDWFHSCGAGRFTAVNRARGEFIYLLDGDMSLDEAFLSAGIDFLRERPRAAGLMGILRDTDPGQGGKTIERHGRDFAETRDTSRPCRMRILMGGGLYRTAALRDAGNFQPFLGAEEDVDISQRLRAKGYELWYIPHVAATHHGRDADYWSEILRRARGPLTRGLGHQLANSRRTGFFLPNLARYLKYLLPILATLLFAVTIPLTVFTGQVGWLLGNASLEALLCGALLAVKRGDAMEAWRSYVTLKIIGWNVVVGFLEGVRPAAEYPLDVEIVKDNTPAL
jgi:glycosyltransferase involved in cell wall biosynthesis